MVESAEEKQANWQRLVIHKDHGLRHAAVLRLTDEVLLAGRALGDRSRRVRWTAVRSRFLTDQTVLTKIAMGDKDREVRVAALKKLTDQTVLAKIGLGDDEKSVRVAAEGRLQRLRGE